MVNLGRNFIRSISNKPIWTGIGASGGAILGMIFYGESKDWRRLIFIGMVLGGWMSIKLVS